MFSAAGKEKMELKLDKNREYALALEGGGARGAYEIGVWEALEEEGFKITAVSGTSVGAICGAFVVMDELELAKQLWREATYSTVMKVDDTTMRRLMKMQFSEMDIKKTAKTLFEVIKNGGFDVGPLTELFERYVDEEKIRKAEREFFIVTVSLTDRKEMELRARDLGEGEIHDMMLASAYLPVFKNNRLGGKRYVDGGFADNMPVHVLVENGYKDIIAVSLNSLGRERKVTLPEGCTVYEIEPEADLGSLMDFDPEQSEKNLKQGYYDAKKLLYGLTGEKYCIERTLDEQEAYGIMKEIACQVYAAKEKELSLRQLNEKVLPRLALRLVQTSGDYYDLFLTALETAASDAGIDFYAIYKDTELLEMVKEHFDTASGKLPKAFTGFVLSLMRERIL